MFRFGAQRVARPMASVCAPTTRILQQTARLTSRCSIGQTSLVCHRTKPTSLVSYCANTALARSYASGAVRGTTRLTDLEEKLRSEVLQPLPSMVTSSSSTHPAFSEIGKEEEEKDTDMMAGVKHDIKVIKDTFALERVPREALNIGLAGVLPYLATSAATVFCAIEMKTAIATGSGFILSEAGAEAFLHVLEPIQVGYGAVILSCLGTIHWGLEWAKFGGSGGYKRYAIGVLAPAVAWPTIFLPVEYALIAQFLAFNLLYAVDSSATVRGWTPPWYSSYRFILTFVVGASIVVSLIGRGQIQDQIGKLPTAADRFRELQAADLVAGPNKPEEESEE